MDGTKHSKLGECKECDRLLDKLVKIQYDTPLEQYDPEEWRKAAAELYNHWGVEVPGVTREAKHENTPA